MATKQSTLFDTAPIIKKSEKYKDCKTPVTVRCCMCGKILKNEEAKRLGMGKICFKRFIERGKTVPDKTVTIVQKTFMDK